MTTLNLISTAEVAARLGISPRRVRALRYTHPTFPQPVVTGAVLMWEGDKIDRWNATADRRPGPKLQAKRRKIPA